MNLTFILLLILNCMVAVVCITSVIWTARGAAHAIHEMATLIREYAALAQRTLESGRVISPAVKPPPAPTMEDLVAKERERKRKLAQDFDEQRMRERIGA